MGALTLRRGRDAAPVEEVHEDILQYLTFQLSGETYAIGILSIKEILEYTTLTQVPLMPAFIRGVMNLRGAVVPVIDLAVRFGRSETAISRRTCVVIIEVSCEDMQQYIGILVDAVHEVLAIRAADIPFCGHLGMLPQHIHEEGGKYRIKGRDEAGRQRLLEDARLLEEAGAFACVLELVTPPVTAEITRKARRMVTIGIGSGPDCDGQVLVTPDLIGSFPWFTPKFVQPRLQVGRDIQQAVSSWKAGLVLPGAVPR